ncbi:hypothetical protein G3I32_24430 [Streptomyces coelicoflavus]|uniref:Uncharacterized protein n=1 Tax=Streptomyces coelicoflavus TaxID=285562 RepID=A0A7K3PPR4_9ACTN|nr:hypothetical protein [Streptomyces coelicoflavus]
MTPSLRTARACRAAAVLLLAAAGYAATRHPWLALPGLYAAAVFAWCAAREGALHRRGVALAVRAEHLARPGARFPDHDDCCERWWTSLGTRHDASCHRHTGAPDQDRAHPAPQ